MVVKLLSHTDLHVASTAIRKCWASEDKSDTYEAVTCNSCNSRFEASYDTQLGCAECLNGSKEGMRWYRYTTVTGEKDKALIERVGNKMRHASTLEPLSMTWTISGEGAEALVTRFREDNFSIVTKDNSAYIVTTNVRALQELRLNTEILCKLLPESYKYLF